MIQPTLFDAPLTYGQDVSNFARKVVDQAKAERDAAIKAVTDKAVAQGWDAEQAFVYLCNYARLHERFYSWEARRTFEILYNAPHDARAWGGIYKRAVKEGIIRRGTEERADPTRHATLTKCWEVV